MGRGQSREKQVPVGHDFCNARRKLAFLRPGEIHRRVPAKVRYELGRVVPAEVFKIEEEERAIGTAHRIVEAEVGRTQHTYPERQGA